MGVCEVVNVCRFENCNRVVPVLYIAHSGKDTTLQLSTVFTFHSRLVTKRLHTLLCILLYTFGRVSVSHLGLLFVFLTCQWGNSNPFFNMLFYRALNWESSVWVIRLSPTSIRHKWVTLLFIMFRRHMNIRLAPYHLNCTRYTFVRICSTILSEYVRRPYIITQGPTYANVSLP
jgi:hypothetical protein